MHRTIWLLLTILATPLWVSAQSSTRVLSTGWQFTREATTVEAASSSEAVLDGWRPVRVPHDWAIAGPVDPEASGSTGKLPWKGEGWYRRTFLHEPTRDGQRVYLDFDGVMAFPKVYVNGILAGEWDYGYTPFRVDITPHVRAGATNTVVVHVDTGRWGSRWYPGAGLFRKVTLTVAEPVHLAWHGTYAWTNGDELEGHPANRAWVETTVENHGEEAREVDVRLELVDPDGRVVDASTRSTRVIGWNRVVVTQRFDVSNPAVWDVDHPDRYTVRTTLVEGNRLLDADETAFGFRTFAFTADDGFHLNGRRVQMRGVNLHHDLGPLGAAFNRKAAERQLRIMKEMGVNALRTSHNPAAAEVIELCDELGILVFDEVFDKWDTTAGRPDLEPPLDEFGHRHIRNTVLRDRNAPSVVLWSIGNELGGLDEEDGINPERVAMMAGFVRAYDGTRPVGMGNHIPELVDGKNFAALDVNGWNYASRYDRNRAVLPDQPLIYSETASALSTRGYYEPDLPNRPTDYSAAHQVSSYDLTAAAWSDIADREFRVVERDSFLAGEFVWTGIDYLGEPTPFTQEARSSYFGIVDLCGFPKDRYYLYRSHWRPDEPTIHILPHWNWPARIGQNVPVFVYTNGDSAELFLNGRSLGMRRKGEIPPRLPNLAATGVPSVSSGEGAAEALDGDVSRGWHAAGEDGTPWWLIDLGVVESVGFVSLDTPRKENLYAYTLAASKDGSTWTILAEKPTARFPLWSGPSRVFHAVDVDARYLRVTFTEAREEAPVGLTTFSAYSKRVEDEYYDVTYDYRLRWNDVAYEPGDLRVVAYRDGQSIGEARAQTVDEPAALRLTSDRTVLAPGGDDLAFVTVEAIDAEGRTHPLADHDVHFSVSGPAEIVGVCNGNPLSNEPDVSDHRRMFFGKALVVIRPIGNGPAEIDFKAEAEGLSSASVRLNTQR